MSSLRVTLPARLDLYVKGRAELYLLGAPDLTSASQGVLHATVTSKIRAGYHTAIYRAILATQGDETNVVLKFYLEENSIADLKREAAVYTGQLRDLQGVVIPRYYGLYVGGNEGECGFACIVLEDCGECLKDLFEKHSIEERIEILNQLAEVHKKEFVPHGFEEENVVGEPGAYRLIGLRDAHQTDHKCGFDGQWHVGGMIPYNKHTCNWLLYRGKAMRIYDKWGDGFVEILGRVYFDNDDYPCQSDIDKICEALPEHLKNSAHSPSVSDWLKKVRIAIDDEDEAGKTVRELLERIKKPKTP